MNFDFSDKEKAFFAQINDAMTAFADERDLESADLSTIRDHLSGALAVLAPQGYLKIGLAADKEPVSGSLALMAAMEQLSGISPSIFLSVEMSTRFFGRIVNVWDSVKEKKIMLDDLMAGDVVGAVALSESTMNVENEPLATAGIRDGNRIMVSGSKAFVINGPMADWFAVVGSLDDQTVAFLIEKETPGLTLTERMPTMGYDGVAICGLELEGVRVPQRRVIGPFETRQWLDRLKRWENQILIAAALG